MAALQQGCPTGLSNLIRSRLRYLLLVPTTVGVIAAIASAPSVVSEDASGPPEPTGVASAPGRTSDAAPGRGAGRTPLPSGPLAVTLAEEAATVATTQVPPTTTAQLRVVRGSQSGIASYYLFKPGGCAHKSLPKGTVVTVTNNANGKSTTCTVNDRGPFIAGRIIDLDTRVFKQLASTSSGVFTARITW